MFAGSANYGSGGGHRRKKPGGEKATPAPAPQPEYVSAPPSQPSGGEDFGSPMPAPSFPAPSAGGGNDFGAPMSAPAPPSGGGNDFGAPAAGGNDFGGIAAALGTPMAPQNYGVAASPPPMPAAPPPSPFMPRNGNTGITGGMGGGNPLMQFLLQMMQGMGRR